ncbi:cytochrome P450 [Mycena albidolilacea]|uniref:Cytochrome P450 n=1 Tax=Mycena albidolilacea TaxID=1033008 RepID=A0AAD7EUC2_9AGAR|nr:cytochrome P450 [Mycena albidolilacea]
MLSSLSTLPIEFKHALIIIICSGLTCHLTFNRLEPRALLHFLVLLGLPPILLTPLVLPHTSGILSAAVLTFGVYLSSLATSILAYRVSPFHPLAKYPGPLPCKLSKLWFTVIAMDGKQHLYYLELHQRYGDVVRIGPNELSFRDVNAIVPMMGSKGMPKGPWWDGRVPESREVRPLLALRDPEEHARRRRAWNRAFSTPALKDYEVLIDARISQLVDILTTKIASQKPVDLSKWLGWLTYDIMNDIMFSGGGDSMEFEDRDDTSRLLGNAQPMALLMGHLPWLGQLYLWLPGMGQGLRAFRKYAADRASERKARGSHHKDVFYHLIDEAGVEPTPPSSAQILSDGGLAIIAGAETTSTTLSHIIWFLLNNPTAYQRLQAEVDDPKRNTWVAASQARMPYLNAVINEALRLFPAVLSGSQRAPLVGSGGQTIGSHFVPEGTSAVVHTYSLHHDPRYFSPFPDNFIPERWLASEAKIALDPTIFSEHEVIHNTAAFIPFSVGPSNCVGRNLAYQEMRMVICTLISKFDMRFEEGFDVDSWEKDMLDYFVVQRGRLPVVLTPRSS